jgi:hypothetical protein
MKKLQAFIESESSTGDANYACEILRTGTQEDFLSALTDFLAPLVITRVAIVLDLINHIRSGEGQRDEQDVAHLVHQTAISIGARVHEERMAWDWVYGH